jgi:hypothetical protein
MIIHEEEAGDRRVDNMWFLDAAAPFVPQRLEEPLLLHTIDSFIRVIDGEARGTIHTKDMYFFLSVPYRTAACQ